MEEEEREEGEGEQDNGMEQPGGVHGDFVETDEEDNQEPPEGGQLDRLAADQGADDFVEHGFHELG